LDEFGAQAEQYRERIRKMEEEFAQQMDDKEVLIQSLNEQLSRIHRNHELRMHEETTKREDAKMKFDVDDRDKVLKNLKFEFLLNNQKKM